MKTIAELVREAENNDQNGTTLISKYVDFSLRQTIEKIDAYTNSKHISGDTDSLGREKPFFNIVTAAINIWYRATDIDRKNIRFRADKSNQYVLSFLYTILLQEWMLKSKFGVFLNDWGRTLAKYGSAVSKLVEKNGELICEVVPWNRLICDPIDFENNIKIEKLYFTPAQLKQNTNYDKEFVDELCESLSTRELITGETVDNRSDYIPVYEVHGKLPLSYLTDNEEDDEVYVQQMHVISFANNKSGQFDDYTLVKGRERKDPYFIAHLAKEDGRTMSIGAVENLFNAQWMVNHSQKQIKDQLDLASKIIFQTSDGNFVGQNALTNIENGDILIYAQNQPLTQINNKPDIGAMQAFQRDWQSIGNQINGIADAMITQAKSGTAWRQTQAELQEAHSLFELFTENKGLALEEMLREYVIPFFTKKLNNSDEISAILEDHQVKQLDMMYVPNEAIRIVNQKIKDTILSGQIFDPTQQEGMIAQTEEQLRQELNKLGNQRFIKPGDIETTTWKEVLKDFEGDIEIDITGENKDLQSMMTTLTTTLQAIATNPMILQDPNAKLIFNRLLETVGGISPIEIQTAQAQPQLNLPAQPNVSRETMVGDGQAGMM